MGTPPRPEHLRFERSCLVLDFDGTILDTEQPVYQSWAELWDQEGVELPRARWQAIIGTDAGFDPWAELELHVGRALDPALQEKRRIRRDELQARYRPRDGVLAWLEQAHQMGVPSAIASSSPADWVQGHLERCGLGSAFPVVVCRDDVVPPKPDPTSYREACHRLGADAWRSAAVEDSHHGVTAAVAAGLFTVAVPHGLTRDHNFSAADLIVDSLDHVALADVLELACRRPRR